MTDPAITVHNLSKAYRLGVIGRQTLQDEVCYWWHRFRGRDPLEHMGVIGRATDRAQMTKEDGDTRFWALKEVSFDVQPGEVLGIIGRNGAGKSTLLKILSRITEPTEGEAVINGRVASLLEVGTGFHPELTGRENVYMNGTILGMKKKEVDRKFDEIVGFAELDKFIDTPVKRYSSGMYVRLAFAVAAHLDPEILLVDEVLAVGDAEFQKKCLGKMRDVAGGGRTVLFVSHNMSAINRLCGRAILIDEGRVRMDGLAQQATSLYLKGDTNGEGRIWSRSDAPGAYGVKLLSTCVCVDQLPAFVVEIKKDVQVNIRYQTLAPNILARIVVLFHAQGTLAFLSMSQQEVCHSVPGDYTATVVVPANTLAETEYSLGVSIFTSSGMKKHYVYENNVVSFQIFDDMHGTSARGDYAQDYVGVMRPLCKWVVKNVSSQILFKTGMVQ